MMHISANSFLHTCVDVFPCLRVGWLCVFLFIYFIYLFFLSLGGACCVRASCMEGLSFINVERDKMDTKIDWDVYYG